MILFIDTTPWSVIVARPFDLKLIFRGAEPGCSVPKTQNKELQNGRETRSGVRAM